MGTVRRSQYTMPLPAGAEIIEQDGQRIARWRLRKGQLRTAEVFEGRGGDVRVRRRSKKYMAKYRDWRGEVVEFATDCTDKVAAQAVLNELQRRTELVRAGVMTEAEDLTVEHATQPLDKHLDAYERRLQAKGCEPRRIGMLRRRIERVLGDCRVTRLNRLSSGPVERWLVERAEEGMAAATRNSYRESLVGFGNWCRRTNRLTHNPFVDLPRADQKADRRHHRRALTEDELLRLFKAARWRSLAEYGRDKVVRDPDPVRPAKSRATWTRATLTYENLDAAVHRARLALQDNPDLIEQLERTGRERELIYRTLVLTGLRKGELGSLTVGQLELSGPVPYAILDAADEKNRQGSDIPLRADLADDISEWLDEQLEVMRARARRRGDPIPDRLPGTANLFNVPSGLSRIFDRDLAAAGIAKRDERGRVVDVHALRVTFGTHLCAAGVPLRTAQAAMRHSKPELTANIYTDPKLLDKAGAINALPALSTNQASPSQRALAT